MNVNEQIVKVSDIVEQKLTAGRPVTTIVDKVDELQLLYGKDVRVVLDFYGISLSDAISYDDKFKQLLLDDRYQNVYLMFHGEREVPRVCKLLLRISGRNETRIIDVPLSQVTITPQDNLFAESDKSNRLKRKLLNHGNYIDKTAKIIYIYYHENRDGDTIFESFTSKDSVVALRDCIIELSEKSKIKNVIIDFTGVELVVDRAETLIDILCLMLRNLKGMGIQVSIQSDNDRDVRYISMTNEIPQMERDPVKIIQLLDENLELYTVGLLSEYVNKPNKLDAFGHYGGGEVATRQVAVYLGNEDNKLKFRVYDNRLFVRAIDREIIERETPNRFKQLKMDRNGLSSTILTIPVSQIGVCKFCDGPRYYFALPVQERSNEFIRTHYRNADNEVGEVNIMLPTFISLVLNENAQDYNSEMLKECEKESIKRLTGHKIEIPDIANIDFSL